MDLKLANQLQQLGHWCVLKEIEIIPKTIFETISGEKITIKTDGKMTPTNPTIDKRCWCYRGRDPLTLVRN